MDSVALSSLRSENCASMGGQCFGNALGSRAEALAVTFGNDHGAQVSFRVNFGYYLMINLH